LLAANIDSSSLIARRTSERNWKKGLDQAAMIICDPLAANKFKSDARIRVFPIVSAASIIELQKLV